MAHTLVKLFDWLRKRQPDTHRVARRETDRLIEDCHALVSERGEVSGTRIATGILATYQTLSSSAREQFFDLLIRDFSPDPEEVGKAGDAYRSAPSPETLARLQHVVESPRQELFRRLNVVPGGTRVLVKMRADLLKDMETGVGESMRAPVAADLGHLLNSWFNRGFLVLERIDWRTSANVLEKLIEYEAVHQIQGWPDLRRRLEADRRCYGFFHPAMPEEPVIFIEAALTRGISDKLQPLLDPQSPVADANMADCALFYSITNCQKGLRGVPFGSFLIKQVVEELERELPKLRRFATISPVPGFRKWLEQNSAALKIEDLVAKLAEPGWSEDPAVRDRLKASLVPLCARYLLREKVDKEPLDPVARFHLRNGARLERINWLSDTTAEGFKRSAGFTVNYLYRRGDLERNHEQYTREAKIVASPEVENLAASRPPGLIYQSN
jgi:malonyl-CoA decarboxylase